MFFQSHIYYRKFTTVEENMLVFISRQIERTKLDINIYINVGIKNVKNFMYMVSTNSISNCPILVEDISNDENIYGPSMASLKGNSTRRKPRPVIKGVIKIPSEI